MKKDRVLQILVKIAIKKGHKVEEHVNNYSIHGKMFNKQNDTVTNIQ